MMDTLEELQYIPIKDDIRQRLAAFFGVSNVFMNDVSGGGLNNEGMQIVVSNRAVAYAQSVYNKLLFPALMDAFNVSEWSLTLSPHEEEDEIMQLRRDEMAIRNMMQMKQAGFDANLREGIDDLNLKFDYKQPDPQAVEAAQQAAAAAQGGGGGSPPPQGGAPVQTSLDELVITPEMILKRTKFDSVHGQGIIPESEAVVGHLPDLPALRGIGNSQINANGGRGSLGESPERIERHEGAPAMASKRGKKYDDDPPSVKAVEDKLKRSERQAGLRGQR
jgi:hypothetical protein